MKDSDHHMRHPRGHLGDRASARGTRGCAWRDDQFGRGQNPVLGWRRPHFRTRLRGQSDSWVAPAQQETSFGARGENLVEATEEGRNYLLQLRLRRLLQLGMRLSPGKTRNISNTRMRKVTQKKAPDWAGATPLFRLSAAQKVRGVAPALTGTSSPAFCALAFRQPENLSDKKSDNLYEKERRSPLSILKSPPKQPKAVTIQARVEESVKTQLELYAEFIDASPSYVITEALKLLFRKDDDFRRWADQHANNHNNGKAKGDVLAKAV